MWTGKSSAEVTLELRPEGNREKEVRTSQSTVRFRGRAGLVKSPGVGTAEVRGRARRLGWWTSSGRECRREAQ